jgi:hypothetical protein
VAWSGDHARTGPSFFTTHLSHHPIRRHNQAREKLLQEVQLADAVQCD